MPVTLSFTVPFLVSVDKYAVALAPGGNAIVNVNATPALGFVGAYFLLFKA